MNTLKNQLTQAIILTGVNTVKIFQGKYEKNAEIK